MVTFLRRRIMRERHALFLTLYFERATHCVEFNCVKNPDGWSVSGRHYPRGKQERETTGMIRYQAARPLEVTDGHHG